MNDTQNSNVLAALPAGFTPITNPPGWPPATDLELYRELVREDGCGSIPAGVAHTAALGHALRTLASAHTELGAAMSARLVFNTGRLDVDRVAELRSLPRPDLFKHFNVSEVALTPGDEDIAAWIDDQTAVAFALEQEHRRLVASHAFAPGSVSLCELHQLARGLGFLAMQVVEHYWRDEIFPRFFDQVMRSVPGCSFHWTCAGNSFTPNYTRYQLIEPDLVG